MAEVLAGVHQVEGMEGGMNVYLVRDAGGSWTQIDTGLPGSESQLGKYLAQHKISPTSIRTVLLTHLHRDHVGALKKTLALTHAKSVAHWIEAAYIAWDPKYDGPGMHPLEPVEVDQKIKDGDSLDMGGGLVAYHTPGHTPGHTAFYSPSRKILFSGDLFFGMGPAPGLTTPEYSHHIPTAVISARRVRDLAVDSLMTYHGGPYLSGAGPLLHKLVQTL